MWILYGVLSDIELNTQCRQLKLLFAVSFIFFSMSQANISNCQPHTSMHSKHIQPFRLSATISLYKRDSPPPSLSLYLCLWVLSMFQIHFSFNCCILLFLLKFCSFCLSFDCLTLCVSSYGLFHVYMCHCNSKNGRKHGFSLFGLYPVQHL